jgi:hypothetical protein
VVAILAALRWRRWRRDCGGVDAEFEVAVALASGNGGVSKATAALVQVLQRWRRWRAATVALLQRLQWRWLRVCSDGGVGVRCNGGVSKAIVAVLACGNGGVAAGIALVQRLLQSKG